MKMTLMNSNVHVC